MLVGGICYREILDLTCLCVATSISLVQFKMISYFLVHIQLRNQLAEVKKTYYGLKAFF